MSEEASRRGSDRALIGVVVAVVVNAGSGIWWAASITAKLDSATEKIAALQNITYTRIEARGDGANTEIRLNDLLRRVNNLEEMRKGER